MGEKANHVKFAQHLQAEAVVAKHDEGDQCARHAEDIGAEDGLPHRASPADAAHEERRSHRPYHPVRPEEDGPVLREEGFPQRIRPGAEPDEVLEHVPQGGEACLQDVHRLPAEGQHIQQQPAEQAHTGIRQPGDARDALENGNSVHQADDRQDCDGHELGSRDAEQGGQRQGQERRRHREGGRRAGDEGDDGEDVNELALPAVGLLPEDGAAGFGVLLLAAAAHMQHEAEAGRQHGVKAPGDEAPVEQRVGAGPELQVPESENMFLLRVGNPLAEGVKQDVRRQAAGKHHCPPGEKFVLWFLSGLAEDDAADGRKAHPQGHRQHAESDDQVVKPQFIPQEAADGAERIRGADRVQDEEQAQHKDGQEGVYRCCRVDAPETGFQILVHSFSISFAASRAYSFAARYCCRLYSPNSTPRLLLYSHQLLQSRPQAAA